MVDIIHALTDAVDKVGLIAVIVIFIILIGAFIGWENWKLTSSVLTLTKELTTIQKTTITDNTNAMNAMNANTATISANSSMAQMHLEKLDKIADLTKVGNTAIAKLADSFGSDPLKLCKQSPCGVSDEHVIAKFSVDWKMPAEKVKAALDRVKRLNAEHESESTDNGAMLAH